MLKGRYVVVRYVADVLRDEPINIGVILECPEANFRGFKLLPSFRAVSHRTSRLLEWGAWSMIKELRDFFSAGFFREDGQPVPYQDLEYLAATFVNQVQFTEPRACLTADPHQEIEDLYRTFVASRPRVARSRRITTNDLRFQLEISFGKRGLLKILRQDVTVEGRSGTEFSVDFFIKSGARVSSIPFL